MITAVCIVPAAPWLLPEYGGLIDPAPEVRAEILDAVRAASEAAERIVVLTATDREPRSTKSPLGVRVAEHLLAEIGRAPTEVVVIPWDAAHPGPPELGGDTTTALLVVADGSARRTEKAPGHLDERAASFDAVIDQALASADLDALLALDPALAADLLAQGRAPLQALAGAVRGIRFEVVQHRMADPFGVAYWVTFWRRATESGGQA